MITEKNKIGDTLQLKYDGEVIREYTQSSLCELIDDVEDKLKYFLSIKNSNLTTYYIGVKNTLSSLYEDYFLK